MKAAVPPGESKPNVNPWLIILFTAPIPLVMLGFLLVKWYTENSDLKRTTRYFVQRQNTVLAYDAMEVSSGISDLLEKTARDVRIMALLPRTAQAYARFHAEQMSDYTQFYTENEPPKQVPLAFFNHQMILSPSGEVRLRFVGEFSKFTDPDDNNFANLSMDFNSPAANVITRPSRMNDAEDIPF